MKLARKIGSSSNLTEVTDEIYNELKAANQFIISLAEGYGHTIKLSSFEGRYYISEPEILRLVAVVTAEE